MCDPDWATGLTQANLHNIQLMLNIASVWKAAVRDQYESQWWLHCSVEAYSSASVNFKLLRSYSIRHLITLAQSSAQSHTKEPFLLLKQCCEPHHYKPCIAVSAKDSKDCKRNRRYSWKKASKVLILLEKWRAL